jgi:surfeit locus 1 family protein
MTPSPPPRRRAGLDARGWIVLLAAVLGVALTARLGAWQLDRAAQKTALQGAIDERRALPPVPTAALAQEAADAAAQHHRLTALHGHWLAEATVYLENRQMHGRPGFFVLSVLRLDDGSAVLVQRGWLPRDPVDRTRVAAPALTADRVVVTGRIAPAPGRLYEFEGGAAGVIRQNLDVEGYAAEIGQALRPWTLLQDRPEQRAAGAGAGFDADAEAAGEGRADRLSTPIEGSAAVAAPEVSQVPGATSSDGLLRDWPAPAADVHKHYGYAFQWFALAALILGLYVWFQLLRPRRPAGGG